MALLPTTESHIARWVSLGTPNGNNNDDDGTAMSRTKDTHLNVWQSSRSFVHSWSRVHTRGSFDRLCVCVVICGYGSYNESTL